ncbi:MAG: hypothetical protein JNK65_03730 [Deltaproteobacteria bacterium]|nr:hypothetical protein [Deltaproteobacteria bacterium]
MSKTKKLFLLLPLTLFMLASSIPLANAHYGRRHCHWRHGYKVCHGHAPYRSTCWRGPHGRLHCR